MAPVCVLSSKVDRGQVGEASFAKQPGQPFNRSDFRMLHPHEQQPDCPSLFEPESSVDLCVQPDICKSAAIARYADPIITWAEQCWRA